MEPVTLLAAARLLWTLGKAGHKAYASDALDGDDLDAGFSLLDTIQKLRGLSANGENPDALEAYAALKQALVVEVFFDAYRQHMPFLKAESSWRSASELPKVLQQHIKKYFEKEVVGVSTASASITDFDKLDQWLGNPMSTPVYQRLWALFLLPIASEDERTALVAPSSDELRNYLIACDEDGIKGKGRRAFERIFRTEYTRKVSEIEIEELEDSVLELKRQLFLELIMNHLASWKDMHVAQQMFREPDSSLGSYPLQRAYIPPSYSSVWPEKSEEEGRLLTHLISRTREPSITLVTAHFGFGKSMTSRMLAAELAEQWLQNRSPGVNQSIPIYISCPLHFDEDQQFEQKTLERYQRRSAHEILRVLGFSLRLDDPAIPVFDQKVSSHVIFDGLDEVYLSEKRTMRLLQSIDDRCGQGPLISATIFSRPGALGQDVRRRIQENSELPELHWVKIKPLDEGQTQAWCEAWNEHHETPLDVQEVVGQSMSLGGVPILLYMLASISTELPDGQTLTRAQLYSQFIRSIAWGKHEDGGDTHDVIRSLGCAIASKQGFAGEGRRQAVQGMLLLLERLAWRRTYKGSLGSSDIEMIVCELAGEAHDNLDAWKVGALLALQSYPGNARSEVFFKHKSFQEYLTAAYWSRVFTEPGQRRSSTPTKLATLKQNHPLTLRGEGAWYFFLEMVLSWSDEQKERFVDWSLAYLDERFDFPSDSGEQSSFGQEQTMCIREVVVQALCVLGHGKEVNAELLRSLFVWRWLSSKHFTNWLLPGCCLRNVDLDNVYLMGADLRGADLSGSDLTSAQLQHANLSGAILQGTNLTNSNLIQANLLKADLTRALLFCATADDADLTYAILRRANLARASFMGAFFHQATLEGAHLDRTNLLLASLKQTDLSQVDLTGANLEGATLPDGYEMAPNDPDTQSEDNGQTTS